MSDTKFGEFGVHGKKRAKTRDLEDGPSSFRSSLPSPPWYGTKNIPDRGIEDSGGSASKQQENGRVDEELDPLTVFGSGIMMIILSNLDARSVAQSRLVSRDWCTYASSDKIWAPKNFHFVTLCYLPSPVARSVGLLSFVLNPVWLRIIEVQFCCS